MSALHVVVGAGQVGVPLAQRLLADGHQVRMLRHSAREAVPGAELLRVDLADAPAVRKATEGAAVIYHCANPDYFTALWARLLPIWTESLIGAASASGARLVVLDNVYPFGDLKGKPLNEDATMQPSSKKGTIRAQVAERFMAAHAKGEAKVVIGRASDFYGPGATKSYFGDQFWPSVLAGKPAYALGSLESLHTYHYIPDVVAGLAALGNEAADVTGSWWMLPCQPAVTPRALGLRLAAAAAKEYRSKQLPLFLFPLMGLFIKELPELREMLYQWDSPFVMDDRKFRARFPEVLPMEPEAALRATAAWAVTHYAKP